MLKELTWNAKPYSNLSQISKAHTRSQSIPIFVHSISYKAHNHHPKNEIHKVLQLNVKNLLMLNNSFWVKIKFHLL
jgi:hypothetical protein